MSTMSKPTVRKGGRPSKPTDEKRTHVVTIKLNDAEYSYLLVRSKTAGVRWRSMSGTALSVSLSSVA